MNSTLLRKLFRRTGISLPGDFSVESGSKGRVSDRVLSVAERCSAGLADRPNHLRRRGALMEFVNEQSKKTKTLAGKRECV